MKVKKLWIGLIIFIIGFAAIVLVINIQIQKEEEKEDMEIDLIRVIHRCENITDWSFALDTMQLDTSEKAEGHASIKFTSNAGVQALVAYTLPLDLLKFTHIYFSIYHPGATTETGFFRLWEDASNYSIWNFTWTGTWTQIIIDLSSTPDTKVGDMDFSNINQFLIQETNVEDPGESYYVDYFYAYLDITSDIYHGLSFIETPIRDFHKLELMAKGTWEISKNDSIVIHDYYTSNGTTTYGIIFEGPITDFDLY